MCRRRTQSSRSAWQDLLWAVPGSFVETGSYVVGPGSRPFDQDGGAIPVALAGFESNFTITPSPDDPAPSFERIVGQVSMGPAGGGAYCTEETSRHAAFTTAGGTMPYEADIYSPDGSTLHDSGEVRMEVGLGWTVCDKDKDKADDSQDKCEFKVLR